MKPRISPAIQTLLDRMDKFPEEFVDMAIDLTDSQARFAIDDTRWEGVTRSLMMQGTGEMGLPLFTPEEVDKYTHKLADIVRKKLEEDVCSKLVKFEQKQDPRQMELPLGGTGLNKVHTQQIRQHLEAHIKALGLTPTITIKDKTS